MEFLAGAGEAQIQINRLVSTLGVTKGSFYWHFEDRSDFVRCLIDYWDRHFTRVVAQVVGESSAPARERLLRLMEVVNSKDLTKYDLVVRSWATHETGVAAMVRKVDRFRLGFVRSLFAEMGFEGTELEIRTRAFVTFASLELGLFDRLPKKERHAQLRARHAFFTRR
jgi:AcrR family transcriptional regulator